MPLWSPHRRDAGGETLVRMLYQEHGNALLTYATRLTGDRWAAEEVLQETLLRAWRHRDTLDEQAGSIRGWLFTVARNIITDRARSRAARPAVVTAEPGAAQALPLVGDHAQRVVDSMVTIEALEQLNEEYRSVVVELYFHGRTVAEAAQVLGIPAGTVKSRSHRALRSLRDLIGGLPPRVEGLA
ncbi:MAG TPA: sigma-70 family RNA polymerase sigma factor [Candidatus Limnocylindrales bacterium]|nr:sigma-70 family RNA polymerase sigma factor [Candidatus Limnocylindrales bacterium]